MKDCLKGSDWGQRPEHQGQWEDAEITSLPPWLGRASDGGFGALVTSRAMGENKQSNHLRNARLRWFLFVWRKGSDQNMLSLPKNLSLQGMAHHRQGRLTHLQDEDSKTVVCGLHLLEVRSWLKCQLLPSLIPRGRM